MTDERSSGITIIPAKVPESAIERHLVRRAKQAGAEVRKVQWVGRRAAPDRVVMGRHKVGGAPWLIWVEVKKPGGAATFPKDAREQAQQREHERLRAMGQRVEIVDSFESADALFGLR